MEAEPSEIREADEFPIQGLREYLEQLTKQELIEILLAFVEKTEWEDRGIFPKRDEKG